MTSTSRYSRPIRRSNGFVWTPLPYLAKEYNRNPRTLYRWCVNGFFIELGFRVRRDETGHWIVGIPEPTFATFTTL